MSMETKKGRIVIDFNLCKGCSLCVSVCPRELIIISTTLNEKGYYPACFTEAESKSKEDLKCTGCALCAVVCPDMAIEVYRE